MTLVAAARGDRRRSTAASHVRHDGAVGRSSGRVVGNVVLEEPSGIGATLVHIERLEEEPPRHLGGQTRGDGTETFHEGFVLGEGVVGHKLHTLEIDVKDGSCALTIGFLSQLSDLFH